MVSGIVELTEGAGISSPHLIADIEPTNIDYPVKQSHSPGDTGLMVWLNLYKIIISFLDIADISRHGSQSI
jgi:hypothetical protein